MHKYYISKLFPLTTEEEVRKLRRLRAERGGGQHGIVTTGLCSNFALFVLKQCNRISSKYGSNIDIKILIISQSCK